MKQLSILISCIFISAACFSQGDSAYIKLLANVKDLMITDSMHITTENWELQKLDTNDVKKWFAPLLGTGNNNRLKNRSYYLTGKIVNNPGYDLLLILEQKMKSDNGTQVLHFVTTKKEGNYIAHFEASVNGIKKNSTYNTQSTLYQGQRIRKLEEITVNGKTITTVEHFRINNAGRFIQTD